MQNPNEIINALKMTPHPEGGHFKELYRDKNVSVIFYLLKKNENSHWHKLSKNESSLNNDFTACLGALKIIKDGWETEAIPENVSKYKEKTSFFAKIFGKSA